MGEAAVKVAQSCNYEGAGTVEFLYDNGNFYFLEMNTRLQVEHPVTELITGIDLVKEQIRIAEGHPLSFKQEDLRINGHAIELRVYAEDPRNNFLPYIGTLDTYIKPEGKGVRVDDGFEQGMTIPIHYDPMIAKLCTYGKTREECIKRMVWAIDDFIIIGIENTLDVGKFIMQHEVFNSGEYNTSFINAYFTPEKLDADISEDLLEVAAILGARIMQNSGKKQTQKGSSAQTSKSNWRVNRT
jgi:acetyl/propionyl-CoA carboxylase alpha subunit